MFTPDDGKEKPIDNGTAIALPSRKASLHVKRLASLVTEEIASRVRTAEADLANRKRAELESHRAWSEMVNARVETNCRRRSSLWGRLLRADLPPSDEEKALFAETLARRRESEIAGRALWRLIADYLSDNDTTFEQGHELLSSMGQSRPSLSVRPMLYAQSVHDQIQIFRELCARNSR